MSTLSIVLLVILVVLIIACVVLYFLGKKAEKKQAEQQEQLDAVAQTVSMLISGIYITGVKGVRGALETPEKKKGFFARFKKDKK